MERWGNYDQTDQTISCMQLYLRPATPCRREDGGNWKTESGKETESTNQSKAPSINISTCS